MNSKRVHSRTERITICGLMLALSVASMFLATVIPGGNLTAYGLSSIFVAFAIIEGGLTWGIFVYIGTCLLGLVLIPNKLGILPFMIIFGLYPVVKFLIEKLSTKVWRIILKALFFAIVWTVGILLFTSVLISGGTISEVLPEWVLIIGSVVIMFLYDYILSFIITFYQSKRRHIRAGTQSGKSSNQYEFKLSKDSEDQEQDN